jgi:hypothetical protein
MFTLIEQMGRKNTETSVQPLSFKDLLGAFKLSKPDIEILFYNDLMLRIKSFGVYNRQQINSSGHIANIQPHG